MRLRPQHHLAILEMGMYLPGDIATLANIASPDMGIVTNVGPNHLERIGSMELIARGKSELVAALPPQGLSILNGDDPWTVAMAHGSGVAPTRLVGLSDTCDYRAVDIEVNGLEGTAFVVYAEGTSTPFRTRVPGQHTIHAFLAGIAVGRALDINWVELQDSVAETRLEHRQRMVRRSDGTLIIDDSYNAAPLSMTAALTLLAAAPGVKVAVLGDMLELGALEHQAHLDTGRQAAQIADWLIVRGERSRWTAEAAQAGGMAPDRVLHAGSNAEAVETIQYIAAESAASRERPQEIRTTVLVKGSRSMHLEDIVTALTKGGA